jgi:hypothetical protein
MHWLLILIGLGLLILYCLGLLVTISCFGAYHDGGEDLNWKQLIFWPALWVPRRDD